MAREHEEFKITCDCPKIIYWTLPNGTEFKFSHKILWIKVSQNHAGLYTCVGESNERVKWSLNSTYRCRGRTHLKVIGNAIIIF